MGRMAILAVLTLLFSLSIIAYNLNRRATSAVDNYVGYYCETCAHDIASSAVEIYMRKLAENSALPRTTYSISSIERGSATVTIDSISGDTLKLTSVGDYNQVKYTIQNKLYPVLPKQPGIYGAASLSFSKSAKIALNGNAEINGIDKDPPGWPNTSPSDTSSAVAVSSTNNLSAQLSGGSVSVLPSATPTLVPNMPDYQAYADSLIRFATVYNGQTFSSSFSLGTQSQPQVTYITGNSSVSLTGNVTGYGILIVNGSLSVSGTVNFYGLMIVEDSASVSSNLLNLVGNVNIYGAAVLAGQNVSYTQKGNVLVQYSKAALNQAYVNMKPLMYLISDWWE